MLTTTKTILIKYEKNQTKFQNNYEWVYKHLQNYKKVNLIIKMKMNSKCLVSSLGNNRQTTCLRQEVKIN